METQRLADIADEALACFEKSLPVPYELVFELIEALWQSGTSGDWPPGFVTTPDPGT